MPSAEVVLSGELQSAGLARRFVAARLFSWGATGYDEIATLLVSELVSNAALHARTEITVCVALEEDHLRLEVTDLSPRHPIMRRYSAESTTGRGIALIDAMAKRWGVKDRAPGKTVWLELYANELAQQEDDRHRLDLGGIGMRGDDSLSSPPAAPDSGSGPNCAVGSRAA